MVIGGQVVVSGSYLTFFAVDEHGLHEGSRLIALAFGHRGDEVVVTQLQVTEAPAAVYAQHAAEGTLGKLRAEHISVALVLVGMGGFLTEAGVPHDAFLVAAHVQRVAP